MIAYCFVIANFDAFRYASQYQQRSGTLTQNWFLFLAIAGILLLWAGLWYWDKYRNQFVGLAKRPTSLFLELCQAHRLNRAQRALLYKIAEARQLSPPSRIFLDAAALRGAAQAGGPESTSCGALLAKLFGDEQHAANAPSAAAAASTAATETAQG